MSVCRTGCDCEVGRPEPAARSERAALLSARRGDSDCTLRSLSGELSPPEALLLLCSGQSSALRDRSAERSYVVAGKTRPQPCRARCLGELPSSWRLPTAPPGLASALGPERRPATTTPHQPQRTSADLRRLDAPGSRSSQDPNASRCLSPPHSTAVKILAASRISISPRVASQGVRLRHRLRK